MWLYLPARMNDDTILKFNHDFSSQSPSTQHKSSSLVSTGRSIAAWSVPCPVVPIAFTTAGLREMGTEITEPMGRLYWYLSDIVHHHKLRGMEMDGWSSVTDHGVTVDRISCMFLYTFNMKVNPKSGKRSGKDTFFFQSIRTMMRYVFDPPPLTMSCRSHGLVHLSRSREGRHIQRRTNNITWL